MDGYKETKSMFNPNFVSYHKVIADLISGPIDGGVVPLVEIFEGEKGNLQHKFYCACGPSWSSSAHHNVTYRNMSASEVTK